MLSDFNISKDNQIHFNTKNQKDYQNLFKHLSSSESKNQQLSEFSKSITGFNKVSEVDSAVDAKKDFNGDLKVGFE